MQDPLHPIAQQVINDLIQDETGALSTFPFPPNIAGTIPLSVREAIYRWMLRMYIWPQVQERKPLEYQWDKLLSMARASWKWEAENENETSRLTRRKKEKAARKVLDDNTDTTITQRLEISDTVIFDAVDRLTNLNHFIAWKETFPVRYEIPEDMEFPHENDVYSPMSALVKSGNSWLKFNARAQEVYRKGWMTAKHHYTYGVSFVSSEYEQKIEPVPRRQPNKTFAQKLELTKIGITFEPMSIRKLWLNPRVSVYKMNHQACPFFFEETPRFAIIANRYDPGMNPFGFANTESLQKATYLFSNETTEAWYAAMKASANVITLSELMAPEYNVELLWTFYPMLPLGIDQEAITEENPEGYVFDEDGTKEIPLNRWIVQMFGNSLCCGKMDIVRLQKNFYPNDDLPIYGSAHMPTLDDGAYPTAIGSILENHYMQICKALMQYMDNKDFINNPPATVMVQSPAMTKNLNEKGGRIPVMSQNDVKFRETPDATQTTPAFLAMVRDDAKTSSKAVDAILGKAMGSRTSATEASNAFQTAMSGVTTDINLFTHDIFGGYATRVWDYTSQWVDPDILAAITGSYGFAIKPEHMAIRLGLKWDSGSSFIESLTRQQNYRYLLESSQPGDPSINRPYLMKSLLREWGMKDVDKIINDGGMENSIQFITEQTIQTYMGKQVIVDPDQDHNMSIHIKKSFLADHKSVWNTSPEYVVNSGAIVKQIQLHVMFLQLQMQQAQLQQQRMMLNDPSALDPLQPLQNGSNPGSMATTAGQAAQQTGGTQ